MRSKRWGRSFVISILRGLVQWGAFAADLFNQVWITAINGILTALNMLLKATPRGLRDKLGIGGVTFSGVKAPRSLALAQQQIEEKLPFEQTGAPAINITNNIEGSLLSMEDLKEVIKQTLAESSGFTQGSPQT